MTVSVLIPAYNAESTIRSTIDSVLRQTVLPGEILVMDDGSRDGTMDVLVSYGSQIKVFRQPNGGLSSARNALIQKAQGELVAFLDSDDLWHAQYIETQLRLFREHSDVAALFAGHVNFHHDGDYEWGILNPEVFSTELMPGSLFFDRYNKNPAAFASFSFCCVPSRILKKIGPEPFRADGAEDFYCAALLSLLGPVIYDSAPLGAYRVRSDSISSRRLAGLAARVHAFELLESHFAALPDSDGAWLRAFKLAFASHRRSYAKYLMGANRTPEGRDQLWGSIWSASHPASLLKSSGMLLLTYLPTQLQPQWPTSYQR